MYTFLIGIYQSKKNFLVVGKKYLVNLRNGGGRKDSRIPMNPLVKVSYVVWW